MAPPKPAPPSGTPGAKTGLTQDQFLAACFRSAKEKVIIDFNRVSLLTGMSKGGAQNKYRELMRKLNALAPEDPGSDPVSCNTTDTAPPVAAPPVAAPAIADPPFPAAVTTAHPVAAPPVAASAVADPPFHAAVTTPSLAASAVAAQSFPAVVTTPSVIAAPAVAAPPFHAGYPAYNMYPAINPYTHTHEHPVNSKYPDPIACQVTPTYPAATMVSEKAYAPAMTPDPRKRKVTSAFGKSMQLAHCHDAPEANEAAKLFGIDDDGKPFSAKKAKTSDTQDEDKKEFQKEENSQVQAGELGGSYF